MGGVLYDICDCAHKDNRTEINMFLTHNQTIQFSSPMENIKKNRKEILTNHSGSTRQKSNDNKVKHEVINTSFYKSKGVKKNVSFNNNVINIENNFKEKKQDKNKNKHNIIKIQLQKYISSKNKNSFDSNLAYVSNKSINSKIKDLINEGKTEKYIGEKKGKLKDGLGLQIWNNNTHYFGNFKNNKIHGIGKFISGEAKYKGEFIKGESNGYGIYSNSKLTFEGYWINDFQSNYGIEEWNDGSIYKGQYSKGRKNGIGTYIWSDGNKYEGEFKNNVFSGYGAYYYNNGNCYFGQWENNQKNGYGEFITKNKIFIGFYVNGKRNGFGITFLRDKRKYFLGFWKNDNKFGIFKVITDKNQAYGIIGNDGNVKKLKDGENKFFQLLKDDNLLIYEKLFKLDFEDINKIVKY